MKYIQKMGVNMNTRSLKLIRDVIINSGKWASLEIAQDSIYLEFKDVELGQPKNDESLSLSMRFAGNSFISVFYNNIWDIEFLSGYDFKNQLLSEEFLFEIEEIKFIDFEYLNIFFSKFNKEKAISTNNEFDIHNIRNDFFVLFETSKIAVVVGGNSMDFFSPFEKLDDYSLRELSNQWMMYFLKYHLSRKIIKDPMCENHPLLK